MPTHFGRWLAEYDNSIELPLVERLLALLTGRKRWCPKTSWDTRLNTPRAYRHAVRRLGYRPDDVIDDVSVHQMLGVMERERQLGVRYWWEHEYEDVRAR